MILSVEQASAHYGKFQALFGIDLRVPEGQTVAVIGANGAGKSTLLSMITGLVRPTAGRVVFDGADLSGVPAYRRPALGIAMVPEGRKLFPSLTVRENLQMGAYKARPGPWNLSSVYDLFPAIARHSGRKSGSLSGGEAQAVAIGRALMGNPRLLLLDEVLARPRPGRRQGPVRRARRHQGGRSDRAARRAGRQPGARRRRPRLLPARGPRRA